MHKGTPFYQRIKTQTMVQFCKTTVLLCCATFFLACTKQQEKGIRATVHYCDEVLVSEITPFQIKPLDTLLIVDQKFTYVPAVETPVFLLLEFPTGSRIPVLYHPGDLLDLEINDTTAYGTFSATGSKSIRNLSRQRELLAQTVRVIDSLDEINANYLDSSNFAALRTALNEAYVQRLEEHRLGLTEIIDEDTTDLANIMAFYQSFGSLEFFTYERDFAYYQKVDRGLQATYPENEHVTYFHKKIEAYKAAQQRQIAIEAAAERAAVGNQAPEISLPNPQGEILHLSALRGKIVLIDFWASWHGSSRRANHDLVELYTTYKAKGFEIFSVSCDGIPDQPNAKEDWLMAIEKDGLVWPNHVSDLEGWQSVVFELYGLPEIPFSVLIDGEGRIVARNLRGKALEKKLTELL